MSSTTSVPPQGGAHRLTALGHRGDLRLPAQPTFRGLLRGEWRRVTSRRATRVLAALLVAAVFAGMGTAFVTHSRDETRARAAAVQAWESNRAAYEDMLTHMSADERAQQPSLEEAVGSPDNFFQDPRYHFPKELPGLVLFVIAGGLLVALTLGATSVGAEWHAKTMSGLLVWEPRRGRVFAAKAMAVVAVAVGVAVVGLALAIGLAAVVAALRGDFTMVQPRLGPGAPSVKQATPVADALWLAVRGIGLAAGLALAGAAAALLLRSTAAVLGVAFAYAALVESAVRGLGWSVQQHLLSNEAAAWLTPGGYDVYLPMRQLDGGYAAQPVYVSHLHGGLVLLGVITVLTAVAGITFRCRDLG